MSLGFDNSLEVVPYPCRPTKLKPIRGWTLETGKLLGEGEYGKAFKCCKGPLDCNYVLKIGYVPEREIAANRKCASHHVCPTVRDAWECKYRRKIEGNSDHPEVSYHPRVLVSDYAGKTLYSFIYEIDDVKEVWGWLRRVILVLLKLHYAVGFLHHDLNLSNIVAFEDGSVRIIDMETSEDLQKVSESPYIHIQSIRDEWDFIDTFLEEWEDQKVGRKGTTMKYAKAMQNIIDRMVILAYKKDKSIKEAENEVFLELATMEDEKIDEYNTTGILSPQETRVCYDFFLHQYAREEKGLRKRKREENVE